MDKKTNGMTMMEVQAILGNVMNQLMSEGNGSYKKEVHERAEFIAKIAKQMVNNADIVLRADKMCNRNDRINAVIGDCGIDIITGKDHKERKSTTRRLKINDGEQVTLSIAKY